MASLACQKKAVVHRSATVQDKIIINEHSMSTIPLNLVKPFNFSITFHFAASQTA
jgi:hypothetical protein